jgi:hypothetical protein
MVSVAEEALGAEIEEAEGAEDAEIRTQAQRTQRAEGRRVRNR